MAIREQSDACPCRCHPWNQGHRGVIEEESRVITMTERERGAEKPSQLPTDPSSTRPDRDRPGPRPDQELPDTEEPPTPTPTPIPSPPEPRPKVEPRR